MSSQQRLIALDALRGMTIIAMIIVNTPANWGYVYPPLLHAEWIGCTPTDLVFPFFLFIMGFSLYLSTQKRIHRNESRNHLFLHLLKRSSLIFLIGLLLNAFPFNNIPDIRILGVLQRIALVNLACRTLLLFSSRKTWLALGSLILTSYWILLEFIPSPLSAIPTLAYENNWAAWLDQLILGRHTWALMPLMDPEGILSTFPAIVTGIIGMEMARNFSEMSEKREKALFLFFFGFILTAAGLIWSPVFPMIKKLWTSSYVLYTAGLASMTLAAIFWFTDRYHKTGWTRLFNAFGMNPLALYVGSELLIMIIWIIPVFGLQKLTLNNWFFNKVVASGISPENASLLWALGYTAIWALVALLFKKYMVYIKI